MVIRHEWPAVLTGLTATFVGVGVARFAYTPLLPALIEQGWFSASQAAYLGAANLLGYLIGALLAHTLSERFAVRHVVVLSFAAVTLSFLFCASPASFQWFFLWRLVSGIAGAILMVVGPSVAIAATPLARRASVGTLMFTGIGLGALLSALVMPLLLEWSLTATWLVLAALALAASVYGSRCLQQLPSPASDALSASASTGGKLAGLPLIAAVVIAAYALDAFGFVPHTLFWVDYLAREQGQGTSAASIQWARFGLGALLGPLLARGLSQWLGCQTSLSLAYLIKALAVALPLLSVALVSRSVSSFLVGAMVPATVALTSGRLAELVGPQAHKRLWGYATATFALAQASAGYSMSALANLWGSYTPLFAIGALTLAGGCLLVTLSRWLPTPHTPPR